MDDSRELRLEDYLALLKRQWRVALVIPLVVLSLAIAMFFTQDPTYRATSVVLIRDGSTLSLFSPVAGGNYFRNGSTEILVVNSPDYQPQNAIGTSFVADLPDDFPGSINLTVTAPIAEDAGRLATEWADLYVSKRHEFDVTTTQQSVVTSLDAIAIVTAEEEVLLEPLKPIEDAIEDATDPDVISRLTTQRLSLLQALDSDLLPIRSQRQTLASSLASQELLLRFLEGDPELGARRLSTSSPTDLRAPLTRYVALGLVLGALLAIGTAILLDNLRGRIHSEADIARLLPNIPLLGQLPVVNGEVLQTPLRWARVGHDRAFRAGLESIVTSLQLIAPSGPFSLVVTSAEAGVGKSTLAASLAMEMASLGDVVLVADADLRRPRLHEILSTPQRPGVHEALSGGTAAVDALHWSQDSDLQTLSVMPSGDPVSAPAELLFGSSFRTLNASFPIPFDVTIVDAPPALLVTDASLISSDVDITVVVARANQTRPADLKAAVESLQRTTNMIAIVLIGARGINEKYY